MEKKNKVLTTKPPKWVQNALKSGYSPECIADHIKSANNFIAQLSAQGIHFKPLKKTKIK